MNRLLLFGLLALAGQFAIATDVVLVVGAAGEAEYGKEFAGWRNKWVSACERVSFKLLTIDASSNDGKSKLEAALAGQSKSIDDEPLWLVLIGHGTWDGLSARFNLAGPDVSAREIATWLRPIERQVVVVNCSSASAPFIDRLSAPNRVIVTATKSGNEQNYARFGGYFADAIGRLDSDLDHDDSVSVREAFLKAATDAERFYGEQGRIATEHALLDDNGDKKGSRVDLIRGRKKSKQADAKVDGELAGRITIPVTDDVVRLTNKQRERRDALERQLKVLGAEKESIDREAFESQAITILKEIAEIYRDAEEAASTETQ